jgi:hypothetical protein
MKRFSPKNRNTNRFFSLLFLSFLVVLLLPFSGLGSTIQKQMYRIPGTQRPYIINSRTYIPCPPLRAMRKSVLPPGMAVIFMDVPHQMVRLMICMT